MGFCASKSTRVKFDGVEKEFYLNLKEVIGNAIKKPDTVTALEMFDLISLSLRISKDDTSVRLEGDELILIEKLAGKIS